MEDPSFPKRVGGYPTQFDPGRAESRITEGFNEIVTDGMEDETEQINGMGSGDSTQFGKFNTVFEDYKDLPEAKFWTPQGMVSFEEWKKQSAKCKKNAVYPAYVPSIISEPYGTLIKKHGMIFGSNEKASDDDCGAIFRKVQCSGNHLHAPAFRHVRCNDPGCPVCYVKYASRAADRVTERIQGYKTVWRKTAPYHLIFWSDRADRPYADLRQSFDEARRLMSAMGVQAAACWYHPYRIKPELKDRLRAYRRAQGLDGRAGFWKLAHDDVLQLGGIERYMVYGPHWHAIATGYLVNVKEYSEKTGCGYKKKRYLDTEDKVHEVAHYITTHCCREATKSSVRYYGDLSYRMLARELVETRIKNVVCSQCGANLEEYDCDDTGVVLQKLKDKITEKIKYFLYWKKGQPKPDMATHSQCLITRFSKSEYS